MLVAAIVTKSVLMRINICKRHDESEIPFQDASYEAFAFAIFVLV